MPNNHYSLRILLVETGLLGLAVLGTGFTALGATTPIPALYDSPSASRLQTLPHDWSLKIWEGIGQVQVVKENHRKVLRLETEQGGVSLSRPLTVNLQANPLISWEWNVLILPTGAASRQVQRDDHGAAVYLVFSSGKAPDRKTTIGYIWDNALPVGTDLSSPNDPFVHYVVVRSGRDQLGNWLTEERNVLSDYRRVFGEEPAILNGISLVVDSDQTHSKAASLFGPITFSPEASLASGSHEQRAKKAKTAQQNKLLAGILIYLGLKNPGDSP
ncbi:MAG: DUF3047 domain-containing protein [Nitrospirota bacterium]|nr:DUF3047 domain-containing protein [Nitrospirota bacterium]